MKQKRKAIFFCLLLFLLFNIAAIGQSYFYFQTDVKSPDSTSLAYYIFLTVNTDGSSTGKILFKDHNGANILVSQSFTDSSSALDNNFNDSLKYLSPFGVAKLADGTIDSSFIKPRFIFKKQLSDSSVFYAPVGVEYSFDNTYWYAAVTISAEQKNVCMAFSATGFCWPFFNRYDPFYKYLLVLINADLTV